MLFFTVEDGYGEVREDSGRDVRVSLVSQPWQSDRGRAAVQDVAERRQGGQGPG